MDQFVDGSKINADGWFTFYWGKELDEYEKGDIAEAIKKAWLKYFIKKSPEIRAYEKND